MYLRLEEAVDAPAEAVWQLLGPQFAEIADWATVVRSSRAIEPSEVPASLTVAPDAPVPGRETTTKITLVEVLTAYSDRNRSLTFEAAGMPRVIRLARDTQSVVATGAATSVVTFEVEIDFVGPFAAFGPIVRRRMAKTFGNVLTDLKRHAEASVEAETVR